MCLIRNGASNSLLLAGFARRRVSPTIVLVSLRCPRPRRTMSFAMGRGTQRTQLSNVKVFRMRGPATTIWIANKCAGKKFSGPKWPEEWRDGATVSFVQESLSSLSVCEGRRFSVPSEVVVAMNAFSRK